MKNKLKLFGVIAVVAIIGYSLVGCGIEYGIDTTDQFAPPPPPPPAAGEWTIFDAAKDSPWDTYFLLTNGGFGATNTWAYVGGPLVGVLNGSDREGKLYWTTGITGFQKVTVTIDSDASYAGGTLSDGNNSNNTPGGWANAEKDDPKNYTYVFSVHAATAFYGFDMAKFGGDVKIVKIVLK